MWCTNAIHSIWEYCQKMVIKKPKKIYVTEAQYKVIRNLDTECKKHMTGFDKQLWIHGIRNILGSPLAEILIEYQMFSIPFEQVEDRCPIKT